MSSNKKNCMKITQATWEITFLSREYHDAYAWDPGVVLQSNQAPHNYELPKKKKYSACFGE
jgi:hypothetical protein